MNNPKYKPDFQENQTGILTLYGPDGIGEMLDLLAAGWPRVSLFVLDEEEEHFAVLLKPGFGEGDGDE